MRVVDVPASLDYRNVETIYESAPADDPGPVLFDARRLHWTDPNGIAALLSAGRAVRESSGSPPKLSAPTDAKTVSYLDRMGFFQAAAAVFAPPLPTPHRAPRNESPVLLEVTPIASHGDVHTVVDRVQSRAGAILSRTLGYPQSAVVQFSVMLSEVCQNIVEHAEAPGWVAAQSYNWTKRLGRRVVVIAVSDLGRGFRASLHDEHSERFGDRWNDVTALEAAFLMGLTRFPDTGRGQGIQQIRKQVGRWDGLFSVRSGTARIADSPSWSSAPPLQEGLAPFPGAQINIILPEQVVGDPKA